MAKIKLELEPNPEVTVIGISSHVKDYRLCWSINRALGISLARRHEDISGGSAERPAAFSAYDHEVEDQHGRYSLVTNRNASGLLMKDHREADYFLVVDDELAESTPDLFDRVRKADFVLTAFPLAFEELRAGHKLLL